MNSFFRRPSGRWNFHALFPTVFIIAGITSFSGAKETPPSAHSPGGKISTYIQDDINRFVRAEMEKQHIPGLSLAIVRNGRMIKAEGYGFADMETRNPAMAKTIYQIQSITKTFTAAAALLLVERGKLNLEDLLSRHFSDVPPSWKTITVRHLLNHTSGIKDFINEPTLNLRNETTDDKVLKSLYDRPLNFSPGEKYAYSNTGYFLLGLIIKKISGQHWSEFAKSNIFVPLHLNDTSLVAWAPDLKNSARGYRWQNGKLQPGNPIAWSILSYPGGGFQSTVIDLVKWAERFDSNKVLKQKTRDMAWTGGQLNDGSMINYGLGWTTSDFKGKKLVAHGGAHSTGFRTVLAHFPKEKLSIAILTNLRECNPDEIANGIASRLLPELRFTRWKPNKDFHQDQTQSLTNCLAELSRRSDCPLLSERFRKLFRDTPERSMALSERLREMTEFTFLRSEDVSDRSIARGGDSIHKVRFYRMTTGNKNWFYTFYFTRENQLAFYLSAPE